MLQVLKLVRQIHVSRPSLFPRGGKANAGIAMQGKALKDFEIFLEDPEGFGDVESDFMNVHKSHKAWEIEEQRRREKVRSLMIKRKYFRQEKLPNLLTYAEKEQIRLLNSRDPEEWTVERLAESFPATPEIIKMIIDAKWRPRSKNRIKFHDEAVIRNWEQLYANNEEILQKLAPDLRNHLKKFTKRTRADLENISKSIMQNKWPSHAMISKTFSTEFQELIGAYAAADKKRQNQQQAESNVTSLIREEKLEAPPDNLGDETYLLGKVVDKRRMRLEDVKKHKLGLSDDTTKSLESAKDEQTKKETQRPLDNPNGTGIVATNFSSADLVQSFDSIIQYENKEVRISAEDQKVYALSRVRDRIYIPRKLRKKGATYKIEDCYYDDDGEFLYRVPGMTK